jgi:hypothetical protein
LAQAVQVAQVVLGQGQAAQILSSQQLLQRLVAAEVAVIKIPAHFQAVLVVEVITVSLTMQAQQGQPIKVLLEVLVAAHQNQLAVVVVVLEPLANKILQAAVLVELV